MIKFIRNFFIFLEPENIKSMGLIFSKDNGKSWDFLFSKKYILDNYRIKPDIIMMSGYLFSNEF